MDDKPEDIYTMILSKNSTLIVHNRAYILVI